jgi:uncharacterized repeat protein (TIGR03943 family)
MTAMTQGTVLVAVGLAVAQLSLTGAYLNYVKPGMRVWLLIGAALLLAIGLRSFLRALAERKESAHGHPITRAAWLLILPVLAVFIVQPDPLGAFAASRQPDRSRVLTGPVFDPLPEARGGVVDLPVGEFTDRAIFDKKRSLEGLKVRLTGFVGESSEEIPGASFVLNRFVISCCAADAYAAQVAVMDAQGAFPTETWVAVTGTWRAPPTGTDGDEVPELAAERVERVSQPENPYEG